MIENRDLSMDDYLAILGRHKRTILIPLLAGPILGFLVSFAFRPKYTSESQTLLEAPKIAVRGAVSDDLTQRLVTLSQLVKSRSRLQPVIEHLGLEKGKTLDVALENVQSNISVGSVQPETMAEYLKNRPGTTDLQGFTVKYTAASPLEAQQVCSTLTSMIIDENLKMREQTTQGTTDFFTRQLAEAKRTLDEQDAKLAAFKRQYLGQLPGDQDQNLKLLATLNSQLEANTQTLNRAQQDRSYTESMLAQQLAAWKITPGGISGPNTLEQQLAQKQADLSAMQARYTDDHPDVIKAKADVEQLKRRIAEVNSAKPVISDMPVSSSEPPEIRQLRLQIHQLDATIAQAGRDQKRIQSEIGMYQGRLAGSPTVEEHYKQLTRDYETAQKTYSDLLAKKTDSEMQGAAERNQQAERLFVVSPASLPERPSFPNRMLFAGGGLAVGLGLGLGMIVFVEMRDKSLHTEKDVEAIMQLPVLISVPLLGQPGLDSGARRTGIGSAKKETIAV
jgi:polysaccharide chain length determinant protein (PEP-CTERM system associated)